MHPIGTAPIAPRSWPAPGSSRTWSSSEGIGQYVLLGRRARHVRPAASRPPRVRGVRDRPARAASLEAAAPGGARLRRPGSAPPRPGGLRGRRGLVAGPADAGFERTARARRVVERRVDVHHQGGYSGDAPPARGDGAGLDRRDDRSCSRSSSRTRRIGPASKARRVAHGRSGTPWISFYTPEEIVASATEAGFADVRYLPTAESGRAVPRRHGPTASGPPAARASSWPGREVGADPGPDGSWHPRGDGPGTPRRLRAVRSVPQLGAHRGGDGTPGFRPDPARTR